MKRAIDLFHFREKYHSQGRSAARRHIDFKLTFEEWLKIWIDSGKLFNRGVKKGQYVMARNGDRGAYELGNVDIILQSQNCKDLWKSKGDQIRLKQSISKKGQPAPNKGVAHTEETRLKISAANMGKKCPKTPEHRRKISLAKMGQALAPDTIAKIVAANTGSTRSVETRLKMSKARSSYWEQKREQGNTVT